MQPRAYLPAPVGVVFAGLSYSNNSGSLLFDPTLPVEDARVSAHIPTLAVGGSFSLLGRSSQVLAVLPYVVADVTGRLSGVEQYRYRSGLADSTFRLAVNVWGAPAMRARQMASFRQRTILGVSLTAFAPTGQYDPNVLINVGTNRWSFKPEIGVSSAKGPWAFEGAFGAWLYTANNRFAGTSTRTQAPLWSLQGHVIRVIPKRHWVALDATYFTGGNPSVNGQEQAGYSSTRLGFTYGLAVGRRHALRFSYFEGVTARLGGDIRTFGVAYQTIWITRP